MKTPIFLRTLIVFLATAVLGAATAEAETLVVASGRAESLVGPLFDRYTKETGRELDVRYNDTPAIATRLTVEGPDSAADVVFLQESGYLGALGRAGLLEDLPREILDAVDRRFRDPDSRWVGTSGRARVMVYGTKSLEPSELPRKLADFADPKWKGKLGWAPSNSSFQAHVSVLRHLWGEDVTRRWLEAVKRNEPVVYPKNSPQVIAAASGEISIGWVNHYYLYRLKTPGFDAANASFAAPHDAGNVLMVAGGAVRKGTPRREAAEAFLAWLVSAAAQTYFAQETFEYPTRPGIPTHADVPALDTISLAPIDQAWLADVGPTLALLEDVGLQ